MKKRFGVAIVGGSGYGAGELLRLLHLHPDIEVCCVSSRSHVGKSVSSIHTHLESLSSLSFEESIDIEKLRNYEKSAFILTMPSGLAAASTEEILQRGLADNTTIIDFSGDFRLTSKDIHEKFYTEAPYAQHLRSQFWYGLPEISTSAKPAKSFITNPGCLATAAILALAPLTTLETERTIVVDAKTGTSGAGREPQASMHHPSRCLDFTAYKTLSHRHEPEILQALGDTFSNHHSMMFVPHLIPTSRGCFVSAYATLLKPLSSEKLYEHFRARYSTSPFIRLRNSPPRLVDVVGTNFCDISIVVRDTQIVVMSALDNLGKGMAGQGIQNLNIAFGLPQERGLLHGSLGPV
jgi:N-acetyl-gamma-glutamyl-phosphate reductase